MPKDDNVIPHKVREPHEWKCKKCRTKGKVASKKDAQMALALHMALMHD